MKSHPWVAEIEMPVQATEVGAESLYAVLQGVNEQRAKRGQRYEAAFVLTQRLLENIKDWRIPRNVELSR